MAIEDTVLSPLNVAGMCLCILGVTVHSVAKVHRARGQNTHTLQFAVRGKSASCKSIMLTHSHFVAYTHIMNITVI